MAFIPLAFSSLLGGMPFGAQKTTENLLVQKEMSLSNRHPVFSVNEVFKDNILLNMAYLDGRVKSRKDISWDEVRKPFQSEFKLEPDQTFAYHNDVYEKYKDSLVKTTNAHFNAEDGFKTDGYLYGDGICHLASIIYWAALEAGLEAEAPTNHDFAPIPDVPREFGVSIYSDPYTKGSNMAQNLYIRNNKSKTISFKFEYSDSKLKVSVVELN